MATHRKYTLPKRRRREGKTDYRKRLKLLLSRKHRLVVRRSNKYIWAQIIAYSSKGDITLVSAHSKELEKYGWKYGKKNLPASYLVGLLIGKRSLEKGIKEAILDIGLYRNCHGSRLYSLAKGAIDAGLNINIGEIVLPKEERIKGGHISPEIEKDMGEVIKKILHREKAQVKASK